jgi:uncharacterized protein (TIGR02268 family)
MALPNPAALLVLSLFAGPLEEEQADASKPVSLMDLFMAGWGRKGELASRNLSASITLPPGESLLMERAFSYRVTGSRRVGTRRWQRLAVELWLRNQGGQNWAAVEAELVGPSGQRLKVRRIWQPKSLQPGRGGFVTVEAEALEGEVRGPYTLTLWSEGRARSDTFSGVEFP